MDILHTLHSLVVNLGTLIGQLFSLALAWSLLLIWTAWWLWGVNWSKMGEALRRGAWAPVVLLLLVAALVWSRIVPGPQRVLGMNIANFWWQLGAVGLLAAYTLFLGWLQGILGWAPTPIDLEPPHIGTDIQHPGHGHHEAEPHPEHTATSHGSGAHH